MKRLRDEISERSPTDLRAIDDSSVPREIAPVVVTINRLFTMLRQSVQSQQQFISNCRPSVAHADHGNAGTIGPA